MTNKVYKIEFEVYITLLESYGVCGTIHLDLLTARLKEMAVSNV